LFTVSREVASASRRVAACSNYLRVDRRVLLLGDLVQLSRWAARSSGVRRGVAEADPAGRLVDQVDRLVGDVAVFLISGTTGPRRPHGVVRDLDLWCCRSARGCRIRISIVCSSVGSSTMNGMVSAAPEPRPYDVLAVHVELVAPMHWSSPRDSGVGDVGRVVRALGRAGTDERVELVE